LWRSVTWLWDRRVVDSELLDAPFSRARMKAAIRRDDLWCAPEDSDVPLDGGYEQRRVLFLGNDADVRDETAFGFLHLHDAPKLGGAMKLPASKDLRVRLEDADELARRIGNAANDSCACLTDHLLCAREDCLDRIDGSSGHSASLLAQSAR